MVKEDRNIWSLVGVLTATRTVINFPRRFPYAFLPEISRQLSVSLNAVQAVVATQSGIGIVAPVFAPLSEQLGRKITLMLALSLLLVAASLGALFPQYSVFYIAIILAGTAKTIFDPASHAYIGDHVPYYRRGAAIGTFELSWAFSLIIAAPVTGFLLAETNLQVVFGCIAVLAILALFAVAFYLPADRPKKDGTKRKRIGYSNWHLLLQPAPLGSLGYAILLAAANEMLFIVYAAWLEVSFDVVVTTLGLVTVVIAAAEIVGEFVVIGMADRIGKQRLAIMSALLASVGYLVLPYLGVSLAIALAIIFILFIGVETAIVSTFPLFTEVLPEARALMMTGVMSAHSIGRLAGAIVGASVYRFTDSFALPMGIAFVLTVLCAWILWHFVPDHNS
jgi:predicted MFS family arabinose efflux permease